VLADHALRLRLIEDTHHGWRTFVDQHTATLLALIERAGIRDRDEAMEIYTLACERLAANECARLRRWDPAKGTLRAWLAVVVRRVIVDWVRSRRGRRRVFGAVKKLDEFHQRVFELYFWDERSPAEMAEELSVERRSPVSLGQVLSAIDAIDAVLSERHRSELVSLAARSRHAVSLDAALEDGAADPLDEHNDVEGAVHRDQLESAFTRALAALPAEDAAIIRLHYVEGLSLRDVGRALHLTSLSMERVRSIVERLRVTLAPFAESERTAVGSVAAEADR
jgi:DNA-directed RNA polymerase specialized sigma24 family protein